MVYCNFHYNFSPVHSKKGKYMRFTAKGNVMLAEQSECVLTTHILVHSCQSLRNNIAEDMSIVYKTGARLSGHQERQG